jgi:hypothetical protein
MANASMLRELALRLDGVTVNPHFDRTAFKVKRIFVTLAADGRTANFKFTPDEQALKCEVMPDAFSPVPNAWAQQGWTTGVLAKMKKAELAAVLEMAWRYALPTPARRNR